MSRCKGLNLRQYQAAADQLDMFYRAFVEGTLQRIDSEPVKSHQDLRQRMNDITVVAITSLFARVDLRRRWNSHRVPMCWN